MRKSRFNEEQIIAILKESEAGVDTGELCRRHGITKASFYRWKSKYGGMDVSEARRLKQLEDENRQLKHVVAELTFRKGRRCPTCGALLVIPSDKVGDRELGVLRSFWIWDSAKQKWPFIRNWEEHKREAIKRFEQSMRSR